MAKFKLSKLVLFRIALIQSDLKQAQTLDTADELCASLDNIERQLTIMRSLLIDDSQKKGRRGNPRPSSRRSLPKPGTPSSSRGNG